MVVEKMLKTHWGRVTHICVGDLTIIGSDNGLSPGRRQAIIWANAGILLIRPLRTNFNEIMFEIRKFSFKEMHMKIPSAKRQPFCLGLNVSILRLLIQISRDSKTSWTSCMTIGTTNSIQYLRTLYKTIALTNSPV